MEVDTYFGGSKQVMGNWSFRESHMNTVVFQKSKGDLQEKPGFWMCGSSTAGRRISWFSRWGSYLLLNDVTEFRVFYSVLILDLIRTVRALHFSRGWTRYWHANCIFMQSNETNSVALGFGDSFLVARPKTKSNEFTLCATQFCEIHCYAFFARIGSISIEFDVGGRYKRLWGQLSLCSYKTVTFKCILNPSPSIFSKMIHGKQTSHGI
jgi:hypothetical protein